MINPLNSSSPKQNRHFSLIVLICLFLIVAGFANFHSERAQILGESVTTEVDGNQSTDSNFSLETNPTATPSPVSTPDVTPTPDVAPAAAIISLEASSSSKTALDLLLAHEPDVQYKEYEFGVFIESIAGFPSNDQNYWAVYHNGAYATTGADKLKLKKGDKVEFKYEKVERVGL